jgi:hypothetical protein
MGGRLKQGKGGESTVGAISGRRLEDFPRRDAEIAEQGCGFFMMLV